MKNFLLISFAVSYFNVFAQFAIIDDKDGFVNVRKTPDKKGIIIDTLSNNKIVWCSEPDGEWFAIDYSKNNKEIFDCYIHKSRLKFISQLDSIPLIQHKDTVAVFQKDSIKIRITFGEFITKNYSLQYKENDGYKYLAEINHKQIWGQDGGVPKTIYKSIDIEIGAKKIKLPKAGLENLFEPTLYHAMVNYDSLNDRLFISSWNSDGAGAYVVLFIIENGNYKERVVLIPF